MQPASITQPDDLVWSAEIRSREGIGDRGFRKWIASGRFPPPDGNFCGRNFWLRSTYERWRADVLEGRYRQQRRPVAKAA